MDRNSVLESSAAVWLRLPSAPAFMCIMRTILGKPVGMPLWKTFENEPDKLSLTNESLSSTFLNLSKNLLSIVPDRKSDKDSVLRISFGGKSWNIYIPPNSTDYQFSFVVAFEDVDAVEIDDKAREQLTRAIVKRLQKIADLQAIINGTKVVETIELESSLYKDILTAVTEVIRKWDNTRIKYLEHEAEKLRLQLVKEAAAKANTEKSQ